MQKHILLVEDDESIREMVEKYLINEGFIITSATNGEEAVQKCLNTSFDLMILDIMMPKLDGLEALKIIREKNALPILIMSAKDSDVDKAVGLGLGADDYIAKPFEPRELLARIRAVIRRHEQPNQADSESDSLTFGRLSVFPDSHEVTIDDQPVRLTTHQFQLLHYFATHSGKVLNREQLWQAMPNDDSSDNIDRAIDVHISRLRALIEDNPRQPKRIITVRGVGYQFATDQV